MPDLPAGLAVVLVPRGAVESKQDWSLAEALAMFVDHAVEDALFEPAELVPDAVAVFSAYRWSGELDSRSNSEWREEASAAEVGSVRRGLELIGRNDLAAHLETDFSPEEQPDSLQIASEVSAWVRPQPWLRILGDGDKDQVYKEVMKRLFRANPRFGDRAPKARFTKAQIARHADPAVAGPPANVEGLIAEVERRIAAGG
ncbi:hypothetical protein GCM10007925_05490 [Sphingomonas astaxanthinifaciens DSM 22298]|uniref:Uncharacterized protein n=1 Tax=Sphingomonas astaxanthinifaciens DSM 22298 TaxID=1123267 RepID=A0ABQ5Z255_9SPHN|nr:hypothetical protein GCM10007925_05490 [Sphingomonas astaxanthinifaciens DSM 22298]